MSVATSTALAIAVPAITAGGMIGKGAIDASAAKNAANIQANSTQQALDFTKAQKAAQENAAAPYLAAGGNAVSHLTGAIRPTPTGAPPSPYSVAPGAMPQGQQTGYSTSSLNAPASSAAYGFAPSSAAPMAAQPLAPQAGQMVKLQSPTDGSVRSVPASIAKQYIDRGAKVITD